MEVAFVELGLLPDVFWDLTWREFDYLLRHHQSKSEQDWDIARHIGYWALQPHVKKRLTPKKLLKLPSEQVSAPTKEEFEALKRNIHG